jgi:hypothetical protein
MPELAAERRWANSVRLAGQLERSSHGSSPSGGARGHTVCTMTLKPILDGCSRRERVNDVCPACLKVGGRVAAQA